MRTFVAVAGILCCAFSAAGQTVMEMRQKRYEVRAGEAIQIAAPRETLDFLTRAKSRRVEIVAGETLGSGLVAGPNRAGDQILLGASLQTKPGEYTVKLSAASETGEEQQATLSVSVKPRVTVPSSATRPPVVLLNGWETRFHRRMSDREPARPIHSETSPNTW